MGLVVGHTTIPSPAARRPGDTLPGPGEGLEPPTFGLECLGWARVLNHSVPLAG